MFINLVYLGILIFLSTSFCRFDELKSNLLLSIPLNKKILNFPSQNGIPYGVPGKIGVQDNMLAISEVSAHTIKIFKDGKLKRLIRSKKFYENLPKQDQSEKPNDVSENFINKLHIPGVIATTSENSFYVLNYIPEYGKKEKGKYNFLHIHFNGKLIFTVNQDDKYHIDSYEKKFLLKKDEGSFSNVRWMDVDDENRLWITHIKNEEIILQAYENGKLLHQFSKKQCHELLFKDIKKSPNEEYSCETFYPFSQGNSILFVGKIKIIKKNKNSNEAKYIFKERIFISYDINSKKSHHIFTHDSDPQQTPYLTHGKKSFIIWKTEDYQKYKLELYNINGNFEKSFRINLPGNPHSWRSTYTTLRGKIYSIQILKTSLSIYEWH